MNTTGQVYLTDTLIRLRNVSFSVSLNIYARNDEIIFTGWTREFKFRDKQIFERTIEIN